MPERAAVDAVHIAVAAVNGMDFLLTWNCRHIANAATRGRFEQVCRAAELSRVVEVLPSRRLSAALDVRLI